jgi:hypothetical protein
MLPSLYPSLRSGIYETIEAFRELTLCSPSERSASRSPLSPRPAGDGSRSFGLGHSASPLSTGNSRNNRHRRCPRTNRAWQPPQRQGAPCTSSNSARVLEAREHRTLRADWRPARPPTQPMVWPHRDRRAARTGTKHGNQPEAGSPHAASRQVGIPPRVGVPCGRTTADAVVLGSISNGAGSDSFSSEQPADCSEGSFGPQWHRARQG